MKANIKIDLCWIAAHIAPRMILSGENFGFIVARREHALAVWNYKFPNGDLFLDLAFPPSIRSKKDDNKMEIILKNGAHFAITVSALGTITE